MGRGLKVLLGLAGVAAVAAAVMVVVFVARAGRTSHDITSALVPDPGRPSGYRGAAYPGMLRQDHVAGPAGVVTALGETVAAGPLQRRPSLLGPTVCAGVSLTNHSSATRDVGPAEWKLQDPDGTVRTTGLTGTLPSVQIAPGGAASGTVCFADPALSGAFVLLWQPLFSAGRGVWTFAL